MEAILTLGEEPAQAAAKTRGAPDAKWRQRADANVPRATQGAASGLFTRHISTPMGAILAVGDDRGLLMLTFTQSVDTDGAINYVRRSHAMHSDSTVTESPDQMHLKTAAAELAEYFAGKRRQFTVPLAIGGSGFACSAWAYLRTVPFGQTRSYGQQAQAMGVPGAARAAGRANGANLLPIIVPCHRIIAGSGAISGYNGGVARKQWLLEHEARVLKNVRADDWNRPNAGFINQFPAHD